MHVPDGKRDVLRHELGGGRVWREFSKRAIAVIQVRKVKTLLMQSTPLAREVVKLQILQDSSKGVATLSLRGTPLCPFEMLSHITGASTS